MSAQTLRQLPAYWRSWSQRTSIEARANALRACADELDAALAAQEPTTDHATAHALLTAWRAEDATLPPEAEQMADVTDMPDLIARAQAFADKNRFLETATNLIDELVAALEVVEDCKRAWFERGWHAALSELDQHGGEWHKWSTPAAAYLAAPSPPQEP